MSSVFSLLITIWHLSHASWNKHSPPISVLDDQTFNSNVHIGSLIALAIELNYLTRHCQEYNFLMYKNSTIGVIPLCLACAEFSKLELATMQTERISNDLYSLDTFSGVKFAEAFPMTAANPSHLAAAGQYLTNAHFQSKAKRKLTLVFHCKTVHSMTLQFGHLVEVFFKRDLIKNHWNTPWSWLSFKRTRKIVLVPGFLGCPSRAALKDLRIESDDDSFVSIVPQRTAVLENKIISIIENISAQPLLSLLSLLRIKWRLTALVTTTFYLWRLVWGIVLK